LHFLIIVSVIVGVFSPTPRVTWSRLDTPMPAKNSNASFGQELVIDVARFSDSGRYQCTAVNTASGRPNAVVDFALTVECEYCELEFVVYSYSAWPSLVGMHSEYQQKLRCKQAHRAMH